MIKEINKGCKASYKGYLLGKKEYEEYMELKDIAPQLLKCIETLSR